MRFSVIIPAFNAEATLAETLESLVRQTYRHWQAVIVDDGSTDGTAAIAHGYCAKDKRFSLYRQSNLGLSEARNTGIAAAANEYLLFLDADDWIGPDYFERFSQEFEVEPALDALVCGWEFVLEDGTAVDMRYPPAVDDMFPLLSHTCPFIVHSCVIRRRLIEMAGVFDPKVGFVEDWDFWQRASRAGARFKLIREVLAYYRMRKGSLSRKVYRSYLDARKMIRQGYAADPRVSYPLEKYRNGMPDEKMNDHLCWLYCWYAGLCLGVGESFEGLEQPDLSGFVPDPEQLAGFVFESVYRGACFLPAAWGEFYREHGEEVNRFFDLLAAETGNSSAIHHSKISLSFLIARSLTDAQPARIGEVLYIPLELTCIFGEWTFGEWTFGEWTFGESTFGEWRVVSVRIEGKELGKIELGSGPVTGDELRKMIGERWAWPIMTYYLGRRHPEISAGEMDGSRGWEVFLQELWGLDWPEAAFYDKSYVDNNSYDTKQWADPVRVDVEKEMFHVVDYRNPVNIEYFVGGSQVGSVQITGEGPLVTAQEIRAAISAHGKFDLCKMAVIQGLAGREHSGLLLREQLKLVNGREI